MPKALAGCLRFDLWTLAKQRESWPILREGVRIYVIHEGPGAGEISALLSYAPGARVPPHRHTGDETIFILEGEQVDESGAYGAGSWLRNPQGTAHSVYAPHGCLVLIHWKAPVIFLSEKK